MRPPKAVEVAKISHRIIFRSNLLPDETSRRSFEVATDPNLCPGNLRGFSFSAHVVVFRFQNDPRSSVHLNAVSKPATTAAAAKAAAINSGRRSARLWLSRR